MVELKDFNFEYTKGSPVLKNINLTVPDGCFACITGLNGSGKTTLLNSIAAALGKDKVSYVFQNAEDCFVSDIVEHDVAFGPENKGLPQSDIRAIVSSALADVGMSGFEKKCISELSGGEKQCIAIAGALAYCSDVILLDEPASMLDFTSRKRVFEVLHSLNKEKGTTVIVVTHDMRQVSMADLRIEIENGEILFAGKPEDFK